MDSIKPLIALSALLTGGALLSAAIPEPVRIDAGSITGTSGTSGEVRVFKGIPFAAPPVGELRWKAPQPPAKWEGVRKADAFGPACLPNRAAASSEDCLYINVWTGAQNAGERRPVIVWTYGGGFASGAGSEPRYDGEALARKGAVVVTYNYRLGVFGFLAHPDLAKESSHRTSGDYALMDMTAALRWVRKNIAAFGGDPERVTIDGESAGAMMVSAMVGSPEGKGLFKRAIAQSGAWMGTGINRMTTRAQAEEAGVKLAQAMGAASISELRAKSAEDLVKNGRFAPSIVVDGWYVPEDLSNTFAKAQENDVDLLAGSNRDEGTFFVRPGPVNPDRFKDGAKQKYGDLTDRYLKLYPAASEADAAASQLASLRDEFGWHMRTWAQLQAKRGKGKAYLFYFTHVPPSPEGRPSRGAPHPAALAYMFENLLPGTPWTDADRKLADEMSSYWVNFAATGNPNGKGLPAWPAYNEKSGQAMVFGDTASVGTQIEPAILSFYDAYYKTLNAGR